MSDDTQSALPTEAIEAAAKAIWEGIQARDRSLHSIAEAVTVEARALMEQAWNEGYDHGKEDDSWTDLAKGWHNPYRDPSMCPSRIPAAPHEFEHGRETCYYCGQSKEALKHD